MNNREILNRLSAAGLIIVFIVFTATFYRFVETLINNRPTDFNKKITINLAYGDVTVRDNSYRYYNGNNFVKLSLENGRKEVLTKYKLLNNISSIYWMKDGVVFNFSSMPQGGELRSMITRHMDNIKSLRSKKDSLLIGSLYWYVNFSSSEISFLTYSENPFGISADPDGSHVYFSDNSSGSSTSSLGVISSEGKVVRDVYISTVDSPARIIDYTKGRALILKSDDKGVISLLSYDPNDHKSSILIQDIFADSKSHTIYEIIELYGDELIAISSTAASTGSHRPVQKINITNGLRITISTSEVSETAVFNYLSSGRLDVLDAGEKTSRLYTIEMNTGKITHQIILPGVSVRSRIIPDGKKTILINRPYIKVIDRDYPAISAIDEKPLEKTYGKLERDIFNDYGDINTYSLRVPTGSLSSALDDARSHIKNSGVNPIDITLRPLLGSGANYDID